MAPSGTHSVKVGTDLQSEYAQFGWSIFCRQIPAILIQSALLEGEQLESHPEKMNAPDHRWQGRQSWLENSPSVSLPEV
jgi:hypothetical protein